MQRLYEEPIPELEVGIDDVSDASTSLVEKDVDNEGAVGGSNFAENQPQNSGTNGNLIQFDDSLPDNLPAIVEYGSNDELPPFLEEFDPLLDTAAPTSVNSTGTTENLLAIIPKPEIILTVEPCAVNASAVNELISEDSYTIEEEDDMLIMFNTQIGFGRPFGATSSALIKRENDLVSGNVPFDELVKTFLHFPNILIDIQTKNSRISLFTESR